MKLSTAAVLTTARRLASSSVLLAVLCVAGIGTARADAQAGLTAFQTGRFSEAYQLWQESARQGDATSALYLGVLYDTGIGVPQNYAQALAWYEQGAQDGSPTAMLNAGLMYDAGRGTVADPESAATWYERAAEGGNGRAEYNLARMYESGSGVAASRPRAVQFYRAAARHGVKAAHMRLRELGIVVARANPRAVDDPAMVSFKRAQTVLLERGVGDSSEAFKFFKAAAEGGNALAAYNLAYYYHHGIGVRPSLEEAVAWYRRSEASATDTSIKELARSGLRSAQSSMAHAQR